MRLFLRNINNRYSVADDVLNPGGGTVAEQLELHFSSGVVITKEEIKTMDPELLWQRLQQLKQSDANYAKGLNDKVLEINALKQKMSEADPTKAQQVSQPTPAPAGPSDVVTQFVMKQMVNEKLKTATAKAMNEYGEVVVDIINAQYGQVFMDAVEKADVSIDFDSIYQASFLEAINNKQDNKAFVAYNNFRNGTSAEAQAKLDEQKEQLNILQTKTGAPSTGLQGGSAATVIPERNAESPRSFKEAREQALAEFLAEARK